MFQRKNLVRDFTELAVLNPNFQLCIKWKTGEEYERGSSYQ
jgi:hypothetical protein